MPREMMIVVLVVATLVFAVFVLMFLAIVRTWLEGTLAGVKVSFFDIIGMKLRRTDPNVIVKAAILLKSNGVQVPVTEIEASYLRLRGMVRGPTELATRILQERTDSQV
jgi:uncharacterized protein YqfA (UPF0365 family)